MKIDKTNNKSIRKAFGEALAQLGEENKDIVVLDADLACSTQTKIFAEKFPERFFDCGIAEQNMTTTAAGLAAEGKIPFIASFAVFATGRNYDQIRNAVCYANFNVKIIGTHCGITVGEDGATHQALEDISLMRGLPNMTVISPADSIECKEAVKYAANHKGPVYIRISRCNVPNIFDGNYRFNPKKAMVVEEGCDISIFTHGEMLAPVLIVQEKLKDEGLNVEVVNVPVIKPLDTETIINSAKKTKFSIVVENHSIIGGLGSAVCETLSQYYPQKVYRIGTPDVFGQSGKSEELLEFYGLDEKNLTDKIRDIYKNEQGKI